MKAKISVDPMHVYVIYESEVLQACGPVPEWVLNGEYENMTILEALREQYGFPITHWDKFIVSEEGVLSSTEYPNDPHYNPLIKIERNGETFYQYQHAMFAIVQEDGSTYVSRID